ncbi:hypothetical protein N6B72_14030 [Chryseobacterium soli]|uniref:hypothetical protein n=1 Tax=Chryseobacterium soli TaxID=445961 RepID=UPI0029533FD9|nr:hypothetical protein [Chryseobacterium soli]MDV7698041.1 hypothetical protein [Chryseobacterium soli]
MKSLHKYFFYPGIAIIPISVIMFLTAIGMFTATGDFNPIIVKLAELCLILYLPFFIVGILFTTTGMTIYLVNKKDHY